MGFDINMFNRECCQHKNMGEEEAEPVFIDYNSTVELPSHTHIIHSAPKESIESWEIKDEIIYILLGKYSLKPLIAHALLISAANDINKDCLDDKFIITVKKQGE